MPEGKILVYATSWCPDCTRARKHLEKMNAVYTLIDIDKDGSAKEFVMSVNNGNRSVPTIVFPDGSILVEPSSSAITQKLIDLKLIEEEEK